MLFLTYYRLPIPCPNRTSGRRLKYFKRIFSGPDLGLVSPQAMWFHLGPPNAPNPNYINNFIKMLLNSFRDIVILQPFIYFFINLGAPWVRGPQALLLLLLCKSATVYSPLLSVLWDTMDLYLRPSCPPYNVDRKDGDRNTLCLTEPNGTRT